MTAIRDLAVALLKARAGSGQCLKWDEASGHYRPADPNELLAELVNRAAAGQVDIPTAVVIPEDRYWECPWDDPDPMVVM